MESDGWMATWLLSLRLVARRPLGPRTSVVIHELVNDDDDEFAGVGFWGRGWATRKPVGLRGRLEGTWVRPFGSLLFLRFDMRAECWKLRGKDTCTLRLRD